MQFSIEISGFDELARKLGMVAAARTYEYAVREAQQHVIDRLRQYPPELPSQTYQRTYRLYDGWLALDPEMPDGSTVSGGIDNEVEYAPLVQHDPSLGDPHQAAIHQGRWPTDLQAVNEAYEMIQEQIAVAVDVALKS